MARIARNSGVGVLDRCVAILEAVANGARTAGEVASRTSLPRSTTHRLLVALVAHGLLARAAGDGFRLGPRLRALAGSAEEPDPAAVAGPVLERLAATTGESAQLYIRVGDERVCVASAQSTNELRTIVPVGARLPITHGSAGKVVMAWLEPEERRRLAARVEPRTPATPTGEQLLRELASIRRRGWAVSLGEREAGVGSVSAPVVAPDGSLVGVVSISGPVTRLDRRRSARLAPAVVEAARALGHAIATQHST
ncbi:MAG: IclR family transcriptional regulator [Actinomycetota bacterium]|nr:MAG: IclR family transcriptional regulator [Actinomycetota bacterium]